MITGFNTDIQYGGVTYHVQTEDKGVNKPIILSLVYNGGTILASKRSPYDDLLTSNFSERVLAERLNKQHRLICAAIQAGRIEDLKKMTAREAAARHSAPPAEPAPAPEPPAPQPIAQPAPVPPPADPLPIPEPTAVASQHSEADTVLEFYVRQKPIPKPVIEAPKEFEDIGLIDEPIIEAIAVIEDDDAVLIPDEAVAIINEPEFFERPGHNKLCIEVLGDARFKGGERKTVSFMVSRGSSRKIVPGAEVMVKILGSSFRPVIFHALTDTNGVATVNLQLPTFTTGRAAFLVRAISGGEEVELRRSIAHG